MSNWTRAHDAHIARECDGLEVIWVEGWGPNGSEPHRPSRTRKDWLEQVSFYHDDPAACIRAAEAWRKQKPGRWWQLTSEWNGRAKDSPARAHTFSDIRRTDSAEGSAALAWALYRATGGAE
jgi:hypothetical protein